MTIKVRAGFAMPCVKYAGTATSFVTGTTTTTGSQIFGANASRKEGCWVQNVDSTAGDRILVGSTAADAVILLERWGSGNQSLNLVFIPGTGPLYIKATPSATAFVAWEY